MLTNKVSLLTRYIEWHVCCYLSC